MNLFGFEFSVNKHSGDKTQALDPQPTSKTLSFVPPENQDGALSVQSGAGAGYWGYYLDLDGTVVDDFSLINRYREMQVVAEVDEALDQIINEFVVQDAGRMPVSLNMDYVDEQSLSENIRVRILSEFDGILKLMNFHKNAYSVIRQWYIDGRLYYNLMVDEDHPDKGIQELRIVDPRTIRKVRELTRKRHEKTQMDIVEVAREYYVYNPMGFVAPTSISGGTVPAAAMMQYQGVKITMEDVAFVSSGLYDSNKRTVLSWLHKAIKPLSLLRMMEDSAVIYRVARAPERRVFYIDVGDLPKAKAEQYVYDIMQKYRNKLVYDVASGEIRGDRHILSMLEDFWMPRRSTTGKGTEIKTLEGGEKGMDHITEIEYFRKKLYRSLNVPPSRIDPTDGFNLGKTSEISRDELLFTKFIHRAQQQFSSIFDVLLERQLRLKNILTQKEWESIKDSIRYDWQSDSYFEEFKAQQVWNARLDLISKMDPFTNRFFSDRWIEKEVLHFSDEEIMAIKDDFLKNSQSIPMENEDGEQKPGKDKKNPFGAKKPDATSTALPDLDDEADEVLSDKGTGDDDKIQDDDDVDDDPDVDKDTKQPPKNRKKVTKPF